MKIFKKYYRIMMVLPIFLVTACAGDFLEETPKASLTPENFYQSANDLELAQAALSWKLNGAFNTVSGLYYGADDLTSKRLGNKIEFSDFDVFNANSSNGRMTAWWNSFYGAIKAANTLIANYENATEASEEQRNNAAGHAYFIRAISYFYLTRTWGEVPMPIEAIVDLERPNAKVEDIYALIVDDLKKSEAMLPDHWSGKAHRNGVDIFPTNGSAKALLANVYLTMAGWPLNQVDKYALAAQKAKEVIDNKDTWGYKLQANFEDIWMIDNKENSEAVFACYYNNTVSEWNWENGTMMGPNPFAPSEEGGWEDGYGEITFYNNFPDGPRKEATYQEAYYKGNDPDDVISWQETAASHPFFLKYRDDYSYDWSTHTPNNWWGSMTTFIIRYPEVLLTYAEAQAMASGPDATTYDAINQVRQRAGLADLEQGLSQTDFVDAVIMERGWEFAAEVGIRWFDLIRTETVAKANSQRAISEVSLLGEPSDVNHTYYWAPLPEIK